MINFAGIAELGYRAYSASTGNKNYRWEEMPAWENLPTAIQQAWIAATEEICRVFGVAVIN